MSVDQVDILFADNLSINFPFSLLQLARRFLPLIMREDSMHTTRIET